MIFKTWLNDINKIALAMDSLQNITQFKTGSTIANGMQLSDVAINKYKASIEGLSLAQAQTALSATALNEAQQKQILMSAGLITSTDSITASEIKQTVTENILTAEKQQEILATFELEMAEGKLKWERLESIATEDTEAGAIARLIIAKKEENAQNLKNIASGKALTTVLKEQLLTLASNPMTWVVAGLAGVVTVAYQCSQAIEEVEAKAQELNETFSTSKTEIKDYKTQIDDLYKIINDSGSSIEDVTTARQNLITIQDQLIEKFGEEKNTINLITDAINGQTDALNILTEAQWQVAKNEFNESGFWNNVANGIDGYSNNIDRMLGEYEGYKVTIDMSEYGGTLFTEGYDEFKQMLMDDFGATISQSSTAAVELSGNASEVRQKLLDIQEILKENSTYKPDDTFSNYLGKLERSADDVVEKYEDFYKQYVLYEEIFTNDTFTDSYKKINDAYSEYQDAFSASDEESIKKAQDNFASILTQATEGVSDESVVDFFNDMYPDLQEVVGNWKFETNFTANTDGLKNDVSSYLSGLSDLYSYDLHNFNYDAATEEQKSSYDGLISVARLYGLTIDQLIDKLVLMGLVQDEEYQKLVDQFGKENVAKIAPEDLTYAYQIKNIGDMSFEELQAEIQRLKDEAQKSNDTNNSWSDFTEEQSKSIDTFQSDIKSLYDALSSINSGDFSDSDIVDLLQQFPELTNKTDDLSSAIQNLAQNKLSELKSELSSQGAPKEFLSLLDGINNSAKDAANGISSFSDALSSIEKSQSAVKDLQDEIRETGKISSSTISSLASSYPQLTNMLMAYLNKKATEKDIVNALKDVYNTDLQNYKKYYKAKMETDENFYKQVISNLPKHIKSLCEQYNVDLKNYKNLAIAKAEIETKLAATNLKVWSTYYTGLQQQESKFVDDKIKRAMDIDGAVYQNLESSSEKDTSEIASAFSSILSEVNKVSASFLSDISIPDFSVSDSKDGSSTTEKTKTSIDWISRKFDILAKQLDVIKEKASEVYSTFKNQNRQLDLAIENIESQITLYKKAYTAYMKQANSVGLSDSLKKKVQNGSMNVSEYSGVTADKIQEYQKYYDLAQDTLKTVTELELEEKELARQKLSNIADDYDRKKSYQEALISLRKTKAGDNPTEKDYNYLIKKQNYIKGILQKEQKALEDEFNALVKNGTIKKYSDEWFEWKEKIVDVEIGIEDCNNNIEDLAENIIDIRWEKFDKAIEKLDTIGDKLSKIKNFFDGDLFDGKSITKTGLANVALGFADMANEKQKLVNYQAEKNRLNIMLSDNSLTSAEREKYEERLKEIEQLEIESALNIKNARQSIIDIYIESIEAETDAMRDLIESKKDSLQAEKDLHSYRLSIANKEEDIAILQKKIAELSKSTDRKDIAMRLELEEELKEAKEDLAEEQYQHDIEQQQDALDEELSDFEDIQNQKIKDVKNNLNTQEKILNQFFSDVKTGWTTMIDYMREYGNEFGIDMTETLTNLFSQAKNLTEFMDINPNVDYNTTPVDKNQNHSNDDTSNNIKEEIVSNDSKDTPINSNNIITTTDKNTNSVNSNKNTNNSSNNVNSGANTNKSSGNTNTTANEKVSTLSGNIKYGDSGSKVTILQKALQKLGFSVGATGADGKFGSKTLAGVKSFQKSTKVKGGAISADGIVGTNTKKKFKANGYKNGVEHLKQDELARINDGSGDEIVLRPGDGILVPLQREDSVLTSAQADNLIALSKMMPVDVSKLWNINTNIPSFDNIQTKENPVVIEHLDASVNLSGITRDEINKTIIEECNKVPDKLAKAAYRGGYRKRL